MPERLRLSRKRGFRLPLTAKSVARPSKWGNPFVVHPSGVWLGDWWSVTDPSLGRFHGHYSTKASATRQAIELFRLHTGPMGDHEFEPGALDELRGKDLACWCLLDQPCHADVLLELANAGGPDA